ncbi:membrane protein DedA with SNARE-associated domain [Actinocorallia herbida]|uniref:Membrane protein DedA with SNARE-associated domain n=1 Tax=Actinocorallia herbida TaxID=58109 RepID=A0A3N1CSD5_9ACTN|nr:DedA family protein [Actinocorallia herbida]ROO84084.1 membrane protein DedA with SNARE-associated domain [Actinocorallia herbida]
MEWVTRAVEGLGGLPFPAVAGVAGLMAFAESGLGVGTVVPGETGVLLLGASATGAGRFAGMLLVVALGVTAGDHVGYLLGRRYGPRMRDLAVVRRLGVRHWDRAVAILRRYGAAAVFTTRLVPVVRTVTPAAAGAARVRYRHFLPASFAGALLWAAFYVGVGAFAGASATRLEQRLGQVSWILLGGAVVLFAAVRLIRRRRAKAAPPDAAEIAGNEPSGPREEPLDVRGTRAAGCGGPRV